MSATYSRGLIILHWLMALLIAAAFALMEFRDIYPKGSDGRAWMAYLHFSIGLLVLALVLIRIFIRSGQEAPPIVPAPQAWQALAAKVGHVLLYAIMIALPVLGYLTVSAAGKSIAMFGLPLPSLLPENKDLSHTLGEVHEALSTVFYIAIGLHVAVALAHHFALKDNTLRRMTTHG